MLLIHVVHFTTCYEFRAQKVVCISLILDCHIFAYILCVKILCVKILFMFIFMQDIRAIYMHYQFDMYIIIIKSQNKHVNINLHIYKLCNDNVYLDILILYFSLM